jgi:hypothetical protein
LEGKKVGTGGNIRKVDSFSQIGALKEEIIRRNPGSIVDLKPELVKKGREKENVKEKGKELTKESRHF